MWVYGVELSCGHNIEIGLESNHDAAHAMLEDLPKRAGGWYAARVCPDCPGDDKHSRRKVVSVYVRSTDNIARVVS